jgi:hypothetical protein
MLQRTNATRKISVLKEILKTLHCLFQIFNWKYTDDGKEEASEEELEVLFNTLTSIDFSDCCLGIAFTMKKLPDNVFAKSSPRKSPTYAIFSLAACYKVPITFVTP